MDFFIVSVLWLYKCVHQLVPLRSLFSLLCPRLSSLLMFACLFPLRVMRHCTAEGKYGTEY